MNPSSSLKINAQLLFRTQYLRRQLSTASGLRRPKHVSHPPSKFETTVETDEESPEVMTIDTMTHVKNFTLAACLLGFSVGVANYSINAVGQSGTDPSDPLSVLKNEAAAAQVKQDQQMATEARSADMIRQFQAGDFDPDKIEDDDDDEIDSSTNKKAWWKFW